MRTSSLLPFVILDTGVPLFDIRLLMRVLLRKQLSLCMNMRIMLLVVLFQPQWRSNNSTVTGRVGDLAASTATRPCAAK
jgi:hypothetical protein